MEINTLFGLPAHPLIVHAAVVLLPIAAIGLIVVALVPKARRHYAPLVFVVALAATIAVGLAQQSGESLEGNVTRTELVDEHTSQGETVLPWASRAHDRERTRRSRTVRARPSRQGAAQGDRRCPDRRVADRGNRCHLDRCRGRPLRCHLGLARRR